MSETARKKMRGERTLVLGSETWGWLVGRTAVVIVSPSGSKKTVNIADLVPDTETPVIGPGLIKTYVEANKASFDG